MTKLHPHTMKTVLTIAGSDSSGGAGIQADIKTITAHRMYAMSAITALTAQNTTGVYGILNASPEFVAQQIDCIFGDIRPDAVKIGMVSEAAIIRAIAERLRHHAAENIVVDPVMIATSGSRLLAADALAALQEELLPLAAVITPNIPEAEVLSGISVTSEQDRRKAAEILMTFGCEAVLIKGGHHIMDADDLLYDGKDFIAYPGERIDTKNTHGTGCTLSSAIAASLAKGLPLEGAIEAAKDYLTGAIARAKTDSVGHGHGPVHHFWFYGDTWGRMK